MKYVSGMIFLAVFSCLSALAELPAPRASTPSPSPVASVPPCVKDEGKVYGIVPDGGGKIIEIADMTPYSNCQILSATYYVTSEPALGNGVGAYIEPGISNEAGTHQEVAFIFKLKCPGKPQEQYGASFGISLTYTGWKKLTGDQSKLPKNTILYKKDVAPDKAWGVFQRLKAVHSALGDQFLNGRCHYSAGGETCGSLPSAFSTNSFGWGLASQILWAVERNINGPGRNCRDIAQAVDRQIRPLIDPPASDKYLPPGPRAIPDIMSAAKCHAPGKPSESDLNGIQAKMTPEERDFVDGATRSLIDFIRAQPEIKCASPSPSARPSPTPSPLPGRGTPAPVRR